MHPANRLHKRIIAATASLLLMSGVLAVSHTTAWAAEPGLVGRTIVVDPGHGGPDSGARGVGGEKEKDITLPVSKVLAQYLQEAGAHVILTRVTDDDLASDEDTRNRRRQSSDLRNRTRIAKHHAPDAFVSIHCNAVPSPQWQGAQTIYMAGNPDGERLAKLIQANFKQMLLPTKREADDMSTLYLLKRIDGPSVLAEIGFLSNPNESAHLMQAKYQQTVAFAIYTALCQYFGADAAAPQPNTPSTQEPAQ